MLNDKTTREERTGRDYWNGRIVDFVLAGLIIALLVAVGHTLYLQITYGY